MKRRIFLAHTLGLAASALGFTLAGMAGRSFAASVQSHRVLDLELIDADRQRPVPVRLYLPEQANPAQPVPLVVFSHGLGGSRLGYSYLASYWANSGVASLHPQHVGSDNSVWRGNPLEMVQRLQSAARESEALARVLDLRFALDHVLASEHSRLIDAGNIAVAGHSYGANTAMLIAGARVASAGSEPSDLRDTRIRAAILISAPPILGQGPADQVLGPVSIPTLHVTSLEDTINIPGDRSTVEDRIAIFDAMNRSPRTLAVFNTGGHSIFTDRTTRSGPDISMRIKTATRELSMLFLQHSLLVGGRTTNSERIDAQAGLKSRMVALSDVADARQNMHHWLERHKDLLDRFVLPNATAT
ncbi:MAG: hypothetical protein RI906_3613 [Pseudomonadota bacterium]|jgi:predicted dienelactone hydrolase